MMLERRSFPFEIVPFRAWFWGGYWISSKKRFLAQWDKVSNKGHNMSTCFILRPPDIVEFDCFGTRMCNNYGSGKHTTDMRHSQGTWGGLQFWGMCFICSTILPLFIWGLWFQLLETSHSTTECVMVYMMFVFVCGLIDQPSEQSPDLWRSKKCHGQWSFETNSLLHKLGPLLVISRLFVTSFLNGRK